MFNSPNNAVRFGESVGMAFEEQQAFPYFYNFVNSVDDQWESQHLASAAGNIAHIGPAVAPLQTVDHPIRLDPDFNFKLLWLKYTAYTLPTIAVAEYRWYVQPVGWFLEQGDFQMAIGTPLIDFLAVSLFFTGPDGRYLYGGHNTDPLINASLVPLPITAVQGYDYGIGQLETPYLLPKNGIVMVRITNIHPTFTIYVGGALYGMKVTV